jgi:hypothetical protein
MRSPLDDSPGTVLMVSPPSERTAGSALYKENDI